MTESRESILEEALMELHGAPSIWIWAFTCPTPGCDCRSAIVLATGDGRDALIARGAPVRDAWLGRTGYGKATLGLEGVHAFSLDIDEGGAFPAFGGDPFEELDLVANPAVRDVLARVDGEVLDAIGRAWYRGKGWQDPEEERPLLPQIRVESWSPGETVAWGEALEGVRQDIYRFGERVFEAIEHYCVKPRCGCGEVAVDFAPILPRGAPAPGAVRVDRAGNATFELTHQRHRQRLEELWAAFRRRHPRFVQRFARRVPKMHALGGKIVGVPRGGVEHARVVERAPAKVGRNDPCPCGSGKKYKKCCGAS